MALATPDKNRVIVEDDGAKLRITMLVSAPRFVPVVFGTILTMCAWAEISGTIALWNGTPRKGEHFRLLWMTEDIAEGADFTLSMLLWLACIAVLCGLLAISLCGALPAKKSSSSIRRH